MNLLGNTLFHPENEHYKYWTSNEEKQLELLVIEGKGYKEISKILGRSYSSCISHGRSLNLESKFVLKKYSVNDNFWEIPNLLNSYWAGFSAADASVSYVKNNYRLEIQKSDEEHLKKIINITGFTGPIHQRIKPEQNSHTVKISIVSEKWMEDLKNKFNIVPNKTQRLEPPILENNLLFAWLIGYTDGDGCIFFNQYNKQLSINYVSSSKALLDWIRIFIERNFPQNLRNKVSNVRKHGSADCWLYSISGIKACVIIDFLRKIPVPHLARKWDNIDILKYIENQKTRFPELFNV